MSTQHSARAITDSVITATVRAALSEDPFTASYDICVDTKAGVVELTGFVDSDAVRIEALRVAQCVEGVQRVEDLLYVRRFD